MSVVTKSLSGMYSYTVALGVGTLVLTVKITLLHLLTARERLLSDEPAQPADKDNFLLPILKSALLCISGTSLGGKAFIERAERNTKNCAENEPYFLALATVGALTGSVPAAVGAALINVYTAARCAHTTAYLLGDKVNSAFRAGTYVTGVVSTLAFAALMCGFEVTDQKTWTESLKAEYGIDSSSRSS